MLSTVTRQALSHCGRGISQRFAGFISTPRFEARRQYVVSGTILAARNGQQPITDLISAIKTHDVDGSKPATLLLALSPAYAKHARSQELPLAVTRQLLGSSETTKLRSLTTVVDGLASGDSAASSQGLAFVLQSAEDSISDAEPLRPSAQRPGALSFDVQRPDAQSWRIQLPLSQTVFSTGLTSTLISRDTSASSEQYLEGATFKLESRQAVQVDYPLQQLTTYRTVGHSMGNIVRTLVTLEDNSEEPASRNLESAVAAYFKALDIPPEPVNVWALIIPKAVLLTGAVRKHAQDLVLSNDALKTLWTTTQDVRSSSDRLKALLERRARLVKVLSGGGGWGKKAGLLSLDPDLEYSTRELRDDHGWQFDFDQGDDTSSSVGRQIDQALGASVEEGDGIVFLIAPKTAAAGGPTTTVSSMGFGVAEKTDSLDGEQADQQTQPGEATLLEDFFGITSETGLGLTIREGGKLINKTKLEVPGLYLSTISD